MKLNQEEKTSVELRAKFNSDSKRRSIQTMGRELKGLGLNICVAVPVMQPGKKRLQFPREHKDWTLEQWKTVMWSDESRLFWSVIKVIMPHCCVTPCIDYTCNIRPKWVFKAKQNTRKKYLPLIFSSSMNTCQFQSPLYKLTLKMKSFLLLIFHCWQLCHVPQDLTQMKSWLMVINK